ncbi:MAG: hypothetical protein WCA10_25730 [Terracidiphilus sp.]
MTNLIKSTIRTIAALVAAAALSPALHAQSTMLKAQVPFAFEFGRAHMEPGTYTFDLRNLDLVILRNQNGSSYLDPTRTDFHDRPSETGRLVFKKFGEHYVLCEARIPGSIRYLSIYHAGRKRWMKENQLSSNDSGKEVTVALLAAPTPGRAD